MARGALLDPGRLELAMDHRVTAWRSPDRPMAPHHLGTGGTAAAWTRGSHCLAPSPLH